MASNNGKTIALAGEEEQKSRDSVMFEDILEECCGTGRWQAVLAGYMSVLWVIMPVFTLSMMFVGATPQFKCADGYNMSVTFASLPDYTPRCHPAGDNSSSCSRWVFDKSEYESTVVTEWNLVCGRKPLLSMLQSWLMIGGVIGSLIGGQLADRLGRRTIFLPASLLLTLCSFSVALVGDYVSFAIARCLMGISMSSVISAQSTLVTEISGSKHRAALSTVLYLPFVFGTTLVAAASYGIRTRWLLQLALAAATLLFLPNFLLMPESPRWLVVQGRFKEALEVLRSGARWNGRQMPPDQEVLKLMSEARRGLLAREAALKDDNGDSVLRLMFNLVRTQRMRIYTVTGTYISFITVGLYYGISFDVTQLSRSPRLAAVLSALGEIPGYFVFPLLNRFGRRCCMVVFQGLTGFVMLLVFATEDTTFRLVLGIIGKLGITATIVTASMYISECMPTQQRGLALGVMQMAGRVGGTVSPFVVDLVSDLHEVAPSGVFGAAALLASLVTLLLPETKGRHMPETVADVEAGFCQTTVNAVKLPPAPSANWEPLMV